MDNIGNFQSFNIQRSFNRSDKMLKESSSSLTASSHPPLNIGNIPITIIAPNEAMHSSPMIKFLGKSLGNMQLTTRQSQKAIKQVKQESSNRARNRGPTKEWNAAARGDVKTLSELIKSSPEKILVADKRGRSPLHVAAEKGARDVITLITSEMPRETIDSLLTWQDNESWIPLQRALLFNNPESAQILLDSGSDINHKDKMERTPIFRAIEGGNCEGVRMMIEAGADLEQPGYYLRPDEYAEEGFVEFEEEENRPQGQLMTPLNLAEQLAENDPNYPQEIPQLLRSALR